MWIVLFEVLINLSAIVDFPLLCVWYMFISLSWKHYLIDLLHNWLHLSSYILFGLPLIRLISDFLKSMINLLLFWYFKGTTHKYLLYMSTGNNKNWNPLLNLVIKWISIKSTRSWPQILSTFRFSNFLIIGLCNSAANSNLTYFLF